MVRTEAVATTMQLAPTRSTRLQPIRLTSFFSFFCHRGIDKQTRTPGGLIEENHETSGRQVFVLQRKTSKVPGPEADRVKSGNALWQELILFPFSIIAAAGQGPRQDHRLDSPHDAQEARCRVYQRYPFGCLAPYRML